MPFPLRNKDEEAIFMRVGGIVAIVVIMVISILKYVCGVIGRYCDDICPKGWMEGDDEE